MVRPCCTHKKADFIACYIPMVREHCDLTPTSEMELKMAVKKMEGTCNGSGIFLSTTSTDTRICKTNGVNRRSVLFIPRSKVNQDILDELDCKLYIHHGITLNYYYMNHSLFSLYRCGK